jgi:hypothetical protein
MFRVCDMSGSILPGRPSTELIKQSDAVDTGAVSAYLDVGGTWRFVNESEVEHYRRNLHEAVITVYVEEVGT